jgi:hypothetical protein
MVASRGIVAVGVVVAVAERVLGAAPSGEPWGVADFTADATSVTTPEPLVPSVPPSMGLFHDREGFGTARGTKPFVIMKYRS